MASDPIIEKTPLNQTGNKMTETGQRPLETILRNCAAQAPAAWFPSRDPQLAHLDPRHLNDCLNRLRMAGYIDLSDWKDEWGQGFRLTERGRNLLSDPEQLTMIERSTLPSEAESAQSRSRQVDPRLIERSNAVRQAWARNRPAYMTRALLIANFAFFGYGVWLGSQDGVPLDRFFAGTTTHVFTASGGLRAADILGRHQWWRLLTCCFVHLGFVHLAVNMIALYNVGPILERLWGSARFLLLYLVSGVCGSSVMVLTNLLSKELGGGAGASGALWGVMGSLGAWLFLNRRVLDRTLLRSWTRQLLINLFLNLAITFGIPDISKAAHFGGLAAGMLAAWPLDAWQFWGRWRWVAGLLFVAIPVVFVSPVALIVQTFDREIERQRQEQALDHMHHAAQAIIAFVESQALPVVTMDPPHRRRVATQRIRSQVDNALEQLQQDRDLLEQLNSSTAGGFEAERRRLLAANDLLSGMLNRLKDRLVRPGVWTDDDDAFIDSSIDKLKRQRS
jgi:membrane associated rhomboid family serine protease